MRIDPNAPEMYTDLSLYSPKEEGIYLVISKSIWTTIPVPIVAEWVFLTYYNQDGTLKKCNSDGCFVHRNSGTPISCTHWSKIKQKIPI